MTALRLSTMLKTCFLACALVASASASASPSALAPSATAAATTPVPPMEVGFGYLGKDSIVNRIMYYQNGTWQKPLSAYLTPTDNYSGVEPHDTVVKAWLKANDAQQPVEADCAKPDLRKPEYAHCPYIKKPGTKLNGVLASDLAAQLSDLPPKVRTIANKERVQMYTPEMLSRLLAWKALKSDKLDADTYATIFWGAKPSVFINWFDISQTNPKSTRSLTAIIHDPSASDCPADVPGIKVKTGRELAGKEGWVATQKWGYRWIPFEKLVDLTFDFKSGAADPANAEIPFPYSPLLEYAKSQWEASEGRTVPSKLKVPPTRRMEAKRRLQATPFRKLVIERAVSYQNRSAMLLFYGEKSFTPPAASPEAENAMDIYYRAWAIRHPDGRVEWISSRFDMDPSASALAHVDETITYVSPHALLEIDGKQFIVAASNLQSAKSAALRSEIYELVNGQFKSRAIYGGACGAGAASK